MMTEKKLIIFSILAIVIGVSSILPVGFFVVTSAKADHSTEPWFGVSVPYLYLIATNGTVEEFSSPEFYWLNESNTETYARYVILNFTLDHNLQEENVDVRVEYFQIQFSTDNGIIDNEFEYISTYINRSFDYNDFYFNRDGWFNTTKMGGGGGLSRYTLIEGLSILCPNGSLRQVHLTET